jgi:hypothetical protein
MLLPIALSFVKLCDPYENSFHAFMIRIHVHTTIYPDENIPTNDTSSTSTHHYLDRIHLIFLLLVLLLVLVLVN